MTAISITGPGEQYDLMRDKSPDEIIDRAFFFFAEGVEALRRLPIEPDFGVTPSEAHFNKLDWRVGMSCTRQLVQLAESKDPAIF